VVSESAEALRSLSEALEEVIGGGAGASPTAVYGVRLEELWARRHTWEGDIPEVVSATVSVLLEHGLVEEGVFRISAQKTTLTRLRRELDRGALPALPADPHLAAGLLKLWLRELPEPLVPPAYLPALCEAVSSTSLSTSSLSVQVEALAQCTASLPEPNLLVLQHLFFLLSRVVAFASMNKMTASNLCVIFSPALFPGDPAQLIAPSGGGGEYAVVCDV
jgi:Rho GTPase-activating protein 22/24/25